MRRLLVAAAGIVGGCLFPSLSDLNSEGGDAADAGDAAAPSDAASSDVDAQSFGDAAFNCDAHNFCDDFDNGALGVKWDSFAVDNVALTLDTDAWVSPPNALLATIPAASTGGQSGVLTKYVQLSPSLPHLVFNFDIRLDVFTPTENDQVGVFAISVSDTDIGYYNMDLDVTTGAWTFAAGGELIDGAVALGSTSSLSALDAGTWRHVTVDLMTGTSSSFSLSFDGQVTATGSIVSLVDATTLTVQFAVTGTYFPSGTAGWALRYDNFTEDALSQ